MGSEHSLKADPPNSDPLLARRQASGHLPRCAGDRGRRGADLGNRSRHGLRAVVPSGTDKDSHWGLSWGYPGSGPGSLALLISPELLDNITARGADNATGAPAGLEKLTQIDWPPGTVFTRAQLEAARDGRPHAEE